jgi:hypothetical protein
MAQRQRADYYDEPLQYARPPPVATPVSPGYIDGTGYEELTPRGAGRGSLLQMLSPPSGGSRGSAACSAGRRI